MATGTRLPALVPIFNPIASRVLRLGGLLRPNALLTGRGRRGGEPRTTPVAVIEVGGRGWVAGPFGDVNWVRNLRSAGEGTLTTGRRVERLRAVELSRNEAESFFADVLGPFVRRMLIGPLLLRRLLHVGVMLDDPHGAAQRIPVFELLPAQG